MTNNLTKRKICVFLLVLFMLAKVGALFAETRYYPIKEIKLTTSDKQTIKVTVTLAYDSANEKQLKNYGGAIPLRLKLVVLKNHTYAQMLNSEKISAEIKDYLETKIFDYPVITAIEYVCRDKSSSIIAQKTTTYTTAVVKTEEEKQPAENKTNGMTVETRISVPEGYERVPVAAGSYEDFYRKLPLKSSDAKVYYYNGQLNRYSYHAAVYDFPNLSEDLLQCADACMKMRAEYYYARGEYDKIGFNAESGIYLSFKKYTEGYRFTGGGWKDGYAKGTSRKIFDEYLRVVYSYASTRSMAKEIIPINIKDLCIGDVFVQSGNPGHAVFVTDMAVNKKTGKKIMLLGQGYMPAQDLHIVKSFESISPWFTVEDKPFSYASYSFPKGCQGRWPER